ncbi:MAG: type II toxin-antitoxin system RelE/ParE family toxin [Clostridia bacterium]|nr:type II toxin-antitoxin system RelE/ParE family toxin [Clostridia bacterium]
MIVRYSPAARAGLREISRYYGHELELPDVAQRIIDTIVRKVSILETQPALGFSLSSKLGTETPLRALITGRYLVVYLIDKKVIRVVRILDTKLDYISVLLER